ncbi:MAG: hypothetical protein AAGF71_08015 [Pseudomonadota bacterium]
MKLSTLLCAALVAVVPAVSSATSLSTTYAGGNGQNGNMFDVLVGSEDITVKSFDMNVNNGSTIVEFWLKTGSAAGSLTTQGDWTLMDSVSVTSSGNGSGTNVDVLDVVLSAGQTYGLYLTTTTGGVAYTNGTAVGNVAAQNDDLTIYEGWGKSYAFGSTFSPRVWNGAINYEVSSNATVPVPASGMLLIGALAAGGAVARRKQLSA